MGLLKKIWCMVVRAGGALGVSWVCKSGNKSHHIIKSLTTKYTNCYLACIFNQSNNSNLYDQCFIVKVTCTFSIEESSFLHLA